ncbi:MAG: beta-propeller domain-containing protein [Bacilli bacterium]|nr:beta-propeller domain-containing protein [Bacilli bacterium]
MKIKDFKNKVRDEANNIEIANMSDEVSSYAKASSINNKQEKVNVSFGRKQIGILIGSSLAVVLIAVVALIAFNAPNNYNSLLLSGNVARPVGSASNLKKMMREERSWYFPFVNFGAKNSEGPEVAIYDETQSVGNGSGGSISETISQVKGIQESEIIKCDAKHIYYAYRNSVEIYEVLNGKATQVTKIDLQNKLYEYDEDTEFVYDYYFTPIEMYLTDDNLILMYEKVLRKQSRIYSASWLGYYYSNTFDTVIQIYNKNNYTLTKEITVPGGLIDGRVYNNYLYFVTSETIQDYKIASVTELSDGDEKETKFDYDDVIYVPDYLEYPYENYICSVNLETLDANYECQLGNNSYETIYMSENAMYLCNNCYNSSNPSEIIYKYAINEDGYLKFASSGRVDGHVNNQYYLDEYNGYLRIATTGRFYTNTTNYTSNVINAVYVLQEKEVYGGKVLEVVGKLDEGIGYPGEQIKSVKFDNEYVSIVTYYQTDPLYLIKFTNNTEIAIVDYLKVPGYSTYLLDIDINGTPYKIGVGLTDDRNYKVSLYQVVDEEVNQVGADFVIKASEFIDNGSYDYYNSYIYTPVVDNIRTMFLYQDTNGTTFIGMNLDEYNNYRINDNYNYEQLGKYLVLRIDPEVEDGIVLVNKLDANSQSARMVAINDYFYLVSMSEAKGYTYNSETKVLDLVE